MIPIRDTTPTKQVPIVNNALIGLNILVFIVQMMQGPEMDRFVFLYGLVPARYTNPQLSAYFSIAQQAAAFITFMFLHGGLWHILGNMWSLYIFGDNVEDHMGHLRYLVFYLICGIASGATHLLLNHQSNIPTIGASGAIAGVMGAYFILHPASKILTLIPILFIPWFVEIPAFVFLGVWFLIQFFNATFSGGAISGIAWWAHIGGFVFGMATLKLFRALPATGFSNRLKPITTKKKSFHFQALHPSGRSDDPNVLASIVISPYEALTGTRKIINLPWGYRHRPIRVSIPSGIQEGKLLRLKGLGKPGPDGRRGDLYLKVIIQSHIDGDDRRDK